MCYAQGHLRSSHQIDRAFYSGNLIAVTLTPQFAMPLVERLAVCHGLCICPAHEIIGVNIMRGDPFSQGRPPIWHQGRMPDSTWVLGHDQSV